jgi:AraC family transcriptional activator FtrA
LIKIKPIDIEDENMRVAVLAHENTALFELSCAVELFGLSRPEFTSWYECDVVSFLQGSLDSTSGVQIRGRFVEHLDDYDMLVVPSWNTNGIEIPRAISESILQFYQQGKRIISFCSGAFLLAELGVLNGRKATTHWLYAEKFKFLFPQVSYVDDVLYIYDGVIGCSAGSASGLDLGVEVIRQDHGYQIANQVSRRLVISAHRQGGQAQFVETPLLESPNQFSQALDWALSHLIEEIDINMLASKANMSRRTFDRKFRSTLKMTPKEWLTQQRLSRVKSMLEGAKHSIEQAAHSAGFNNAITMRHHFKRVVGVTPTQYQRQFTSE